MGRFRAGRTLVVLALLLSGLSILVAPPARAALNATDVEQQYNAYVNSARQMKGLPPLSLDGMLADTARTWSQHMASVQLLSHDPNLAQEVAALDPTWTRIGENVGVAFDPLALWQAFMRSDPHRANILGDYNKMGVGVVIDGSGKAWLTQRFVKGAALPPPPPPPAPPAIVGNTKYHPVTPARVLDTRTGLGNNGVADKLGPGGTLDLTVLGVGGVPASGVTAVVINVTATNPTTTSHFTVYPRGLSPRPTTSNLNFVADDTVADLVVARVGSDGKISIFNNAGEVHAVGDVVGYFDNGQAINGSRYTAVAPSRLLDTRVGYGAPTAKVGPGGVITVQMTGRTPVPSTHVAAVALNVTAVGATASSFVTVWPSDTARPGVSNLNFGVGSTVANMAIATVSAAGQVSFFNNAGSTDIIADVVGYFDDGTTSATRYTALDPARVLDTRNGTGAPLAKVGPGGTISVLVRGQKGVPTGATAVVLTVTATDGTDKSHVTVYPSSISRPNASNLNFLAGQTVPNLVIVGIGTDGKITLFNNAGSVDLLADVVGYMA